MSTARPGHNPRVDALRVARARDSQDKRRRVLDALQALENTGTPITAARLAAAAGVSAWLVYADGVREHVDAARRRQAEHDSPPTSAVPTTGREPASMASLRTDLAVARAEIRRLRAEGDKLRNRLRLHLGAEIEGPERAELIARVAELETNARHLIVERNARAAEADHTRRRVRELEDDLTAARESLRRIIRETNT